MVCFAIVEPTVPKDRNTQIELLSHLLTRLQKKHGLDLSQMRATIKCDNCCRELKNNPLLRWLASLVSSGTTRAARLRNLRSGHSHEDIDQIFRSLARKSSLTRCLGSTRKIAMCCASTAPETGDLGAND